MGTSTNGTEPPATDRSESEPARWVPPPPMRRPRHAPLPPHSTPLPPLPPFPSPPLSGPPPGFEPSANGGGRPGSSAPPGPRPRPAPPGTLLTAPQQQPTYGEWEDERRVLIDERDLYPEDPSRLRQRTRRDQTRMVEAFRGPRLRSRTGWWRRARSIAFLLVVTVFVALIIAGVLAGIVGGISYGISHAINNK
jgi:hypothetical protein